MKALVIHFGQSIPTVGGAVGLNTLCGLGPNGVRSTTLAEVTCKTCLRSGGLEWAQRENARYLQIAAPPSDGPKGQAPSLPAIQLVTNAIEAERLHWVKEATKHHRPGRNSDHENTDLMRAGIVERVQARVAKALKETGHG